jgi:hypothetical protein
MEDFKLGDKVRVLEMAIGGDVLVGTTDFITWVDSDGSVEVGNGMYNYFLGTNGGKLELVKPTYPNPPHIHQKEIKAWADGAQIQWFGKIGKKWYGCDNKPSWRTDLRYRVKPDVPAVNLHLELLNKKLAEVREAMDLINKEIGEL